MKVKTHGLGYLKDSTGKVVSKIDLPAGEHDFEDGLTFVEVTDRAEFEAVPTPERGLGPEMGLEAKIRAELRRMAIESLKAKGEL